MSNVGFWGEEILFNYHRRGKELMKVNITQHPVGQGGFCSGQVDCGGQPLRWVYDCGSNQQGELAREISKVAAKGPVDFLFLSHLDSDHINGVDKLLSSTSVAEIVLPYIDAVDMALAVGADLDAGTLSGTFLDFVSNPLAWAVRRGVTRLSYVSSSDDIDGDEEEGPSIPRPDIDATPDGEGDVSAKWSMHPEIIRRFQSGAEQRLSADSTLNSFSSLGSLDWVLMPHAYKPSRRLSKAFLTELRKAFNVRTIKFGTIASTARTATGREKLRKCYDALWSDHNLVSMSLYSGPASLFGGGFVWYASSQSKTHTLGPPGWICTGDANLQRTRRRNQFIKHYSVVSQNVGVIVLPHHGSMHNFHDDVLMAFPNLEAAIVSAGQNPYSHPHPGVRESVEACLGGRGWAHVNEDQRSLFELWGTMP